VLELSVAPGVVGVLGARPALEEVHAVDALAEVLPEGLLRRHEEDVALVLGLVDLVAHALDHAGGARGPALVVVGLVAGDLGLGALVGRQVSLRYQSMAAAASDWANSM
jgi:hypothetical protein